MKRLSYIVLVSLPLLLVGCRGDNAEVNMGYEYYPAEVGSWIAYQVDSVRHFVEDFADTTHYQIKEVMESAFTDDGGRPARRIERYFRWDDSENWRIKDVWMVVITSRKVEKVEENQRFTRLVFPVNTNQFWDGNALNPLPRWDYSYEQVGETEVVGNIAFENAAVVLQEGSFNLIEQEIGRETYAPGIGLIYKELREIKTDVNYQSDPTPANIQSGYELWYRYVDHGKN